MSEQQPKSFMQELDLWTDANIVEPLAAADPNLAEEWDAAVEQVKRGVRTKVLDSYHNGQGAQRGTVRSLPMTRRR